jgi:hypothetical protein
MDAATLAALTATFQDAYPAAKSGATRGPSSVAAKNTARADVEAFARQLALVIQANPAITFVQKSVLGITLRKTHKTPIQAPVSCPALALISTYPGRHTLNYADTNTLTAKVKPFGVAYLQLSVWIAPIGAPPTGPATRILPFTRNPMVVRFTSADVGQRATYTARWVTAKGLMGPSSGALATRRWGMLR